MILLHLWICSKLINILLTITWTDFLFLFWLMFISGKKGLYINVQNFITKILGIIFLSSTVSNDLTIFSF